MDSNFNKKLQKIINPNKNNPLSRFFTLGNRGREVQIETWLAGLHIPGDQVEPPLADQVPPGKTHDLTDLFPVFCLVAVLRTVFAGRFWVHGALDPFGGAVQDEFAALGAEFYFQDIGIFCKNPTWLERVLLIARMVLPAIDFRQVGKHPYVLPDLLVLF